MKSKVTFLSITTVVAAMLHLVGQAPAQDALETPANTKQALSAERRAEARKRAEEGIRYLNELMAKAQVEAQTRLATFPRKPYDPEAVKAAEKERLLAKRRQLAPWLFASDGKPTGEGVAFLGAKPTRKYVSDGNRFGVPPKVDFARTLIARPTRSLRTDAPGISALLDGPENGPRLELFPGEFNPQTGRTEFELWLIDAPLNEWWEIFRAPVLQSTAWVPAWVGPPVAVSGNIQKFLVEAVGQPQQSYFQTFLHQDIDYDGIPDGYEVAFFKTDPNVPDSNSIRDANGDGLPDYPGLGGNRLADGDEDFDGDGMPTTYELALGVNPLVAQTSTDSDADGLPDWLEALITYWTGDPAPSPSGDSDGDGLNNKTEWTMRLDPSWAGDRILGNFAGLPDDQRAVRHKNLELQSSLPGFAGLESQNPDDAYFDASFVNYHGTAAQLTVLKDTDANGNPASGVDTFKWGVAFQTPSWFVPVQNIPDPDPADGWIEDNQILLQITDCLADVWSAARVNDHLDTLSEPTLFHIQQRSFVRMWMRFRTLQLMMVAQELPEGLRLRTRVVLAEIHTQATILRKTTVIIGMKYPATQAMARMGRVVPVAGALCSVLSAWGSANSLVPVWEQYLIDVWRRCDNNNDTALDLAVGLASIVDNAFPAPVLTAFLWPIWWDGLSDFDGWASACF